MIVTTAEVNAKIAQDENFAKDVSKAMARFLRKDWGDKSAQLTDEDWKSDCEYNDAAAQSLSKGQGGRILGVYGDFWSIRDMVATTILFPHEY